MLKAYARVDKAKAQECDLTQDFLLKHIICKPCTYCGDTERVGCDRVNNRLPHIKANVVPCCPDCNVARGDNFSHEEMLLLGKTIAAIKHARQGSSTKEVENEDRPETAFLLDHASP